MGVGKTQGETDYALRSGAVPAGVASALSAGGTIGAGAVPAAAGDALGSASKPYSIHGDTIRLYYATDRSHYADITMLTGDVLKILTSSGGSFRFDGGSYALAIDHPGGVTVNNATHFCQYGSSGADLPTAALVAWRASAFGSLDLSLYRVGAGVLGIGTGAASGGAALQVTQMTEPIPASNSACFYAGDVAGTAEAFAVDEAGNEVQLTAHASDYPADLVPANDLWPKVAYEYQRYLGLVRWIYRGIEIIETLDEYRARCAAEGITPRAIRRHDWAEDQALRAAQVEAQQAAWDEAAAQLDADRARIAAAVTARHRAEVAESVEADRVDAELAKRAEQIAADVAERQGKLPTLRERPADHVPKDPPAWLAKRLPR